MNKCAHFFTIPQLIHSFVLDFFHPFIVKIALLALLDVFENRGGAAQLLH